MNTPIAMRRAATAFLLASGTVLLASTPAGAHVTVSSPDAEPGGFGKLVYRVPSESDTAKTESVAVRLPADTPFAFVSTKAMPGWTVETTTKKLDEPVESDGFKITRAVTEVSWKADRGSALRPQEFAEFELSVGPFPDDVKSLALPTVQRYSDGEVAAWDEPTVDGEGEPEHPAPVLELSGSSPEPEQAQPASASTEAAGSDGTARLFGGAGVVLGGAGLVVAGVRRRRNVT